MQHGCCGHDGGFSLSAWIRPSRRGNVRLNMLLRCAFVTHTGAACSCPSVGVIHVFPPVLISVRIVPAFHRSLHDGFHREENAVSPSFSSCVGAHTLKKSDNCPWWKGLQWVRDVLAGRVAQCIGKPGKEGTWPKADGASVICSAATHREKTHVWSSATFKQPPPPPPGSDRFV